MSVTATNRSDDKSSENVQNENEESENVVNENEESENVVNENEASENVQNENEASENVVNENEASENVQNENEASENVQNENEPNENVQHENENGSEHENESEYGHEHENESESVVYDPKVFPYGPDYEEITQRHLKEISDELGLIKLSWPEELLLDSKARKHHPPSYTKNNNKEKLLLLYAENFRRQFHFIYTDRKPLLLAAENECGIQKMVCTTIRPTTLHYPEMSTWEGCARFLADHLIYCPLEKSTLIPDQLRSPTAVLSRQKGHCFELSTVLCSFLIGAGYRAYVVSGYATREFCNNDQTRVVNPFLKDESEGKGDETSYMEPKYQIKPPRDLRSKFEIEMEDRKQRKLEEELRLKQEEKQRAIEEFERPAADRYYGLRVHSWVVVLPGSRDISEPFFIEPATGKSYMLSYAHYLGLESLWDNTNYWFNLQNCSEGCKNLKIDLTDLSCWEHLLVGEPWDTRQLEDTEDEKSEILQEKHLDMPASWVLRLDIPHSKFMKRFPAGGQLVYYKKSKVEHFAPYVQRDGLITRVITYYDYDWDEPEWIHETYANRMDCLMKSEHNIKLESMLDTFTRGREDALKELSHFHAASSVEDERTLMFYDTVRVDGLWKLEMHPLYLTEHFKDRYDKLYYRHVTFAARSRPGSGIIEGPKRTVLRLVEKFYRDPTKKANDDIAIRTFALADNQILLKYHYDDDKVIAQTREFIRPPLSEMGDRLTFNPNLTSGYQVDPTKLPPKQIDLFYLLAEQLKTEEASLFHVREIEDEVSMILRARAVEIAVPKLIISLFDKERNEQSKQGMRERDMALQAQVAREVEAEVDFLAPYVARLGCTEYVMQQQAMLLRAYCLADYKQMLVDRANNLQAKFDEGTQHLQAKLHWYEEEKDNLSREEEEDYFDYSNRMTFYLHTLEIRLNRHRDLAPQRYLAMEGCLRTDARLAILYW